MLENTKDMYKSEKGKHNLTAYESFKLFITTLPTQNTNIRLGTYINIKLHEPVTCIF